MDQQESRKKFMNNFHSFCEKVELNYHFIKELERHSNAEYIQEVMVTHFLILDSFQ
jgi:hypothetical protein